MIRRCIGENFIHSGSIDHGLSSISTVQLYAALKVIRRDALVPLHPATASSYFYPATTDEQTE
jgi:hypothetical protein